MGTIAQDAVTGIADLKLRGLPCTGNHAFHLFGLPQHHSEPFDRQIIAQALAEGIPVVTSDEKSSFIRHLEIIR